MSKKITFGEQVDIPKDGDGSAAEESVTLIEDSKSAPRRKSTRKSMAKSTTTVVTTVDAIVDTVESEGAYRGSPLAYTQRQAA